MTVVLGIHDRTIVVTPDTPASLRCLYLLLFD
jgi:hypothetical protein